MPALVPYRWTTERTAALGGVLQNLLHGYTEGAITVTTNLVTLISRFVLQVCGLGILLRAQGWNLTLLVPERSAYRTGLLGTNKIQTHCLPLQNWPAPYACCPPGSWLMACFRY